MKVEVVHEIGELFALELLGLKSDILFQTLDCGLGGVEIPKKGLVY